MNSYDREFLNIFNEAFPFERYIVKEPKPIGNLFDDAVLTEIFVPYTEIKPIVSDDGCFIAHTQINPNDVYIKIKGNAGEMRFGYFDFEEHIREQIRYIMIEDFGNYEYECLYVDREDLTDLKKELEIQKNLIQEKYGECKIKKSIRDNLV